MAHPRIMKVGVDWFPFPTVLSTEFDMLEAEHGIKALAVIVKLLQKIFGGAGYYCRWNREILLLFSKSTGEDDKDVQRIIWSAVKRGIFNERMYKKYGILTSKAIQERYFQIASRRIQVNVDDRYLLIPYTANMYSARREADSACKEANSACNLQQSRVEKSREEESISPKPNSFKKTPKPSAFHNFEERAVDLDEISKRIMEKRVDGK